MALLERANSLLKQQKLPDPMVHLKICFRLSHVERRITHLYRKRSEQIHHMSLASTYGEEALEAAKQTRNPALVAHVEIEKAFNKIREVQFLQRSSGPDRQELKLAVKKALDQLNAALAKMRDLDQELYEKNKKQADKYWLPRLDELMDKCPQITHCNSAYSVRR